MVNTSKILTVSYGTFSCTLEGFDDSFDTMKAIAEYFRDLAADDRYFGAEPPTPDAEMLARIAEREISRRVEAREDQGKIVLRAGEAPALAAAAVATEVVAEAADDVPQVDPVADDEQVAVDEPVADEPAAEEVLTETSEVEPVVEELPEVAAFEMPTTITALMQEEAVLAEEIPVEVTEAPEDTINVAPEVEEVAEEAVEAPAENVAPDEFVEDAVHEPADEETVEAEGAPEDDLTISAEMLVDEPEEDVVAEIAGDESAADDIAVAGADHVETAEEFFENSPEPEEPARYETDEYQSEPTAEPVSEDDSVADRLSRIRSVVSQGDQPYELDDYSEDEHAQDFLDETAAELDAALAEDDAADLTRGNEVDRGMSDVALLASLAGKRARQIDEEKAAEAAVEAVSNEAESVDDFENSLSQLLADSISDEKAPETMAETPIDIKTPEDHEDDVSEFVIPEETAEDVLGFDMPDEVPSHLNASVIKVKREEFEAAFAESMQNETQADEPAASDDISDEINEFTAEADQSLNPEDEEDLLRELAEVEAELVQEDITQTNEAADKVDDRSGDVDETAPVAVRGGRDKLASAKGQSDIERIFDEADSQLEKPESNQRRSAIQHLRAAVAATRAEKKEGSNLQRDVDDSPYRSDLASVVRPRRPSTSDGMPRSQRPVESRPAPLKLVAEQRIDTAREPIRPRRVSAAETDMEQSDKDASNAGSFGDYAKAMGATQLPDLLEAAAAYISDVEGRDQFSRPMLMHKLKEFEKENFAREDGLRSFGQLLREGKIQKIKGGRFAVTEETEFRDEARHAG